MFGEEDPSNGAVACGGDNGFPSKLSQHISDQNMGNPDEKMSFCEKGIGFLRESDMSSDGLRSKPSKTGTSGSQELTLSYLCDNSKLGHPEKEITSKSLFTTFEKSL
ncbi:hypothetical protein CJ030_MR5G008783 [Morella rubra]|uniref:Uncharacterized protein n=1 Tax=Morella rubra TaxID=262757 RepID=A0A6A1UMH5_9ROSI|nr:hypothetical protein CJ030_MR0G003773 [Morella rubra]KAB1228186.1 hypothetical protein CJ030_MR5G008783 [Morella rubra]